jgi:ketosteroid isomerase-like protein
VLRDYERAWQNKDVPQLTGLFTDDGFVLSNTRAPVRGRPDIAQVYQSAGGGLWLRALGYSVGDSVGYIVGAYGYGATPAVPDVGKFVLALRRGPGGHWLIAADIDNTNQR